MTFSFKQIDAFEMILCGASAVQVGTCHWNEGPKCFDRICKELEDLMAKKGYSSIEDFKGKLKEWSKEGVAKSREAKAAKKKLAKDATATKASAGPSAQDQMLTALLVLVIAVLLADKFDVISI